MAPLPHPYRQQVSWEQNVDQLLRGLLKEVQAIRQQRQSENNAEVWKSQNPDLARRCGHAFDRLAEIQNEFIESLVDAVDKLDTGYDSAYAIREFTDRYGNVSTQLNTVMTTLRMLRA